MQTKKLIPLKSNLELFQKQLKILIIVPPAIPLPPTQYGGIERIAYTLIEYLSNLGHNVIVLSHTDSQGHFQNIPIPSSNGKYYSKLGIKNLLHIRRLIQEISPDLVHDFCGPAISLLCPKHIPVIWSHPSVQKNRFMLPFVWRQANTLMIGNAHHITQIIPSIIQRRTIHNSVEFQKYNYVKEVPQDAPLVFLGRLEPIKGTHIAVRIAHQLGEKLIIAGNILPQFNSYFDNEIKPYLSDQIQYIGTVNDVEKNKLFGNAKAFLFPLQVQEAFGITVVESMSCGTPVIAFPYGAMPELIRHGKTGFLCHSEEDMKEKIKEIHTLDRLACRKNVESFYSPTLMCERYLYTYYELLSEKQ